MTTISFILVFGVSCEIVNYSVKLVSVYPNTTLVLILRSRFYTPIGGSEAQPRSMPSKSRHPIIFAKLFPIEFRIRAVVQSKQPSNVRHEYAHFISLLAIVYNK